MTLSRFRAFYCLWAAWSVWSASLPLAHPALKALLIAALLASAAGLAARFSLTASWIAFYLVYGAHRGVTVGHGADLAIPVLILLSAGKDEETWPLRGVGMLLAVAYFGAAYGKLRLSGAAWMDGSSLQAYLLEKAWLFGPGLGSRIAESRALCAVLSGLTVAFELSFPVALYLPAAVPFYLAGGLLFHGAIKAAMSISYFQFFVPAYAALLAPRPSAYPKPAVWLIAILAGGNLLCILSGTMAWPFSYWRFYTEPKRPETAAAYRLRADDGEWLSAPIPHFGNPIPLNDGAARALKSGDRRWLDEAMASVAAATTPEQRRRWKTLRLMKRTLAGDEVVAVGPLPKPD